MGTYRAVRRAPSIGRLRMGLPNRVSCSDTDMSNPLAFPGRRNAGTNSLSDGPLNLTKNSCL